MSTMVPDMNIGAKSSLEMRADRLDSWKQIAVYLDREVRTVQRWEKHEGLPIRRQFHLKRATVYGLKDEIDAWLKNRCQKPCKPAPKQRHSDQFVNWSSPTLLVTRKTANASWVWWVVAPGSDRFDGHPSVVTGDETGGPRGFETRNST